MSNSVKLNLDIQSYWHLGSGKGSGSHLDAVVEKDMNGLPFVSGKMLKGLLRDAVNRANSWNQLSNLVEPKLCPVEILFGSMGFNEDNDGNSKPREKTRPGILRISDAKLPSDVKAWLNENKHHKQGLYSTLFSTAINSTTGVAEKGSLRGMEVIVPMVLTADIQLQQELSKNSNNIAKNWKQIIKHILPLIRAVGAQRTRGFGRSILSLQEV